MTVADDLEGLHHRNTGRHHGGELTAEYSDVLVRDLAAARERLALGLYARGGHALTPQVGAQGRLIRRKGLAAHLVAALVLSLPEKLGFLFARCRRYRHNS